MSESERASEIERVRGCDGERVSERDRGSERVRERESE